MNNFWPSSNGVVLPVPVRPVEAVLSDTMQCSCPSCDRQEDIKSYMYYIYYKQNGNSWTMLGQNEHPDSDGTYHCRAVLGNMRTLPSKAVASEYLLINQLPPASFLQAANLAVYCKK